MPPGRFGPSKPIVEDVVTGALSYRKLLIGSRVLGRRFEAMTRPGEAVGVLLPNANGVVLSLLGLASAGRVAAMMNYTAGPASVTAAVKTADIRTVVSSKAFVEKAGIADIIEAIGERRREARLAGRHTRQRRHVREARRSAAVALCAAPAGGRRSPPSSCSPRGRKARRRPSCSPTGACSPTSCRPRHAFPSRRPTGCSTCCRCSIPSA